MKCFYSSVRKIPVRLLVYCKQNKQNQAKDTNNSSKQPTYAAQIYEKVLKKKKRERYSFSSITLAKINQYYSYASKDVRNRYPSILLVTV